MEPWCWGRLVSTPCQRDVGGCHRIVTCSKSSGFFDCMVTFRVQINHIRFPISLLLDIWVLSSLVVMHKTALDIGVQVAAGAGREIVAIW